MSSMAGMSASQAVRISSMVLPHEYKAKRAEKTGKAHGAPPHSAGERIFSGDRRPLQRGMSERYSSPLRHILRGRAQVLLPMAKEKFWEGGKGIGGRGEAFFQKGSPLPPSSIFFLPLSYLPVPSSPTLRAARKASWGSSTLPMRFMRFLPSFCFSRSFLLRVISPP